MGTYVDIVPAPVPFVQVVGQFVVFKAVDNAVVVHIDAKEELGAIRCIAQERLIVVRHSVFTQLGVVLIEVVGEVVVLVKTGENPEVLRGIGAQPVWVAILVVVVVDEFVHETSGVVVVDIGRVVQSAG